ncbi:X-ray repair cross complementing 2 [Rhodnius prolixus]|uniref:X-ray repair cross complementing 2 n=1 Tax=Rhodnius prolixus TaxID=13249 RepID=UPI003D189720
MSIQQESCLQLLGRLQKRPSLQGLDAHLFPNGPKPREVIEITGEAGTGKTLLLLEFIKKSILPIRYNEFQIDGLEAEVVYMNCDHHFNIFKLVSLMEDYLSRCLLTPDSDLIEEIISTSLKRLTVFNIFDSETMMTTFHLLSNLLCMNSNISLILIDSISAYYWQDAMIRGIRKMDLYVLTVLKLLHKSIKDFQVTVIFTRPQYFQSKSGVECSPVYDLCKINTSIHLQQRIRDDTKCNIAEVRTCSAMMVVFYEILQNGVVWSK